MLSAEISDSDFQRDLREQFGPKLQNDVLEECIKICRLFNISSEELFAKWEAFALKLAAGGAASDSGASGDLSIPTLDYLEQLKTMILKDSEQKINKQLGLGDKDASFMSRKSVAVKTEPIYNKDTLGDLLSNGTVGSSYGGQFGSQSQNNSKYMTPKVKPRVQLKSSSASSSKYNTSMAMSSAINSKITPRGASTQRPSSATNASNSPATMMTPSQPAIIQPSPAASKFKDRLNKNTTVESFNDNIPMPDANTAKGRCEVSLLPNQILNKFRYMHTRIGDKSDLLDARIEALCEELSKSKGWENIHHPLQPSQESITTAGKICVDAVTDSSAKLNEQSVMLEACRSFGSGARVRLDLNEYISKGNGFSFFPGQVVGVKGICTGEKILVEEIIELELLPKPRDTLYSVMETYERCSLGITENGTDMDIDSADASGGEKKKPVVPPTTFMVSCGPYTLEDNLLFEPFAELHTQILEQHPSVVILLGPFIDITHPLLVKGQVDMSIEEMFDHYILAPLMELPTDIQVILIPHSRDAISDHVTFPQPPLSINTANHKNILAFPNPCQFTINETVFAASSTDVLFHMNPEECSRFSTTGERSDKMTRLSKHVLTQHNFYPLFPPNADACIQFTDPQFSSLEFQIRPDVLVTPSTLRHFVKDVEGTVVINPGFISRRLAGGTYVKGSIYGLEFPEKLWGKYYARRKEMLTGEMLGVTIKKEEDKDKIKNELDVLIGHEVGSRCRVDVVKI